MNESLASVNHKQIGYRIKEVREQNNFSQAQLAEEKKQWETFCGSVERVIRGSGYAGTLGTVLE